MRQRLLRFIGPDAHRVNIYTFHSFSNRIIQENLEYFGQQGLEPISELERVEVIRKILIELPIAHPLRIGKSNPYFYEKHLQRLFRIMKMERWNAKLIDGNIEEYLNDLPNRNEFIYQVNRGEIKKGDLKKAKIDDIKLQMKRLAAAADLFPTYHRALQKIRRYDYEDMILWINEAFGKEEGLLRRYQERYLYLLVDEYQDTNGAQNKLIQQLVDFWENPNLFIVGDDDQSIYEFQGARLKNITEYYQKYRDYLQIIVLSENYRSTQTILDRAGQLISNNEIRILNTLKELGVQKLLTASNPKVNQSKILPKVKVYSNRVQEVFAIATEIKKEQEAKLPLEDIAIIYARHRQAEKLIAVLEKMDIPFNAKRTINILDLPLIRQIQQLIEFVALELEKPGKGEFLIYKMLHFQCFKVSRKDIETLNWTVAYQKLDWRDTVNNSDLLVKLNLETSDSILRFGQLIHQWIEFAANHSMISLLEQLINTSGILKYVIKHVDKVYFTQVLHSLVTFTKQENSRNPHLSPSGFLDILRKLDENQIGIPLVKVTTVDHGVHLITAHSAKGLEFRKVYLLDATKDFWEPSGRASRFQFPLPDTLTFSNEANEMEARRRLFYVAMTRAEEELIISYSKANENNKPLERSIYLDELIEGSQIVEENVELEEDFVLEMQLLSLTKAELPTIQPAKEAWINELLQEFRLSASSFNVYLKCPLSFYYEYVLRIPMISSEAASYGTAVHNALESLFQKVHLSIRNRFPAKSTLIRFFSKEMEHLRSNFSQVSWKRYLEQGQHNLGLYYDQHILNWHKNVRVELPIRDALINGVPVKGTIDKLEFLKDNKVRIVDYKTGSHDPAKLRKPTKGNPHGGSYWRQLIFYKLMYENFDRLSRTVESASISYVEPDAKGSFVEKTIQPTLQEVQFVKDLLQSTYQKIQQHDFYQGCGKKDCNWCRFVQDNDLIASFADATELLDDR